MNQKSEEYIHPLSDFFTEEQIRLVDFTLYAVALTSGINDKQEVYNKMIQMEKINSQ